VFGLVIAPSSGSAAIM